MRAEDFWEDSTTAGEVAQVHSSLKALQTEVTELDVSKNNARDLAVMAFEGMSDEDTKVVSECHEELKELEDRARTLMTTLLLDGVADNSNCFIEIASGAGGTESCDYAEILMTMYQNLARNFGFTETLMEVSPGQEAGIKSCVIKVEGIRAFGWLRTEAGIHRLVRVSPFDSNNRRHTSFAQVAILPIAPNSGGELSVEIDKADLKIDTYRSSGPGGQHVNKTDSAVRITHIPTGLVVTCQNERSQHQNKAQAMTMLESKLLRAKLEKVKQDSHKIKSQVGQADFGNQVRSYILHPYKLVKDHRTGIESSNPDAFLKGELKVFLPFIEGALLKGV